MEEGNLTENSADSGSGDVVLSREIQNDIAIVIGLLGFLLNGMSLLIFTRNKKLLSSTPRKIIINQCTIDMVSGIFLIYSQFHSWYLGIYMPKGIPNPRIYCSLMWGTYVLWSLLQTSSWNIQILTIERYISICHSVVHKNYCTKKIIIALLIGVWFAGFGWVIFLASFMKYFPETNACVYQPDNAIAAGVYGTSFFIHSYAVPILILLFCYGRILMALKRRISASSSQEEKQSATKTRSFASLCAIISFVYILCYSCNAIYFFLANVDVVVLQPGTVWYHFTVIMVFINCFINPIIFFTRMKSFRQQLTGLVTCKKQVEVGSYTARTTSQHQSTVRTGHAAGSGSV